MLVWMLISPGVLGSDTIVEIKGERKVRKEADRVWSLFSIQYEWLRLHEGKVIDMYI